MCRPRLLFKARERAAFAVFAAAVPDSAGVAAEGSAAVTAAAAGMGGMLKDGTTLADVGLAASRRRRAYVFLDD